MDLNGHGAFLFQGPARARRIIPRMLKGTAFWVALFGSSYVVGWVLGKPAFLVCLSALTAAVPAGIVFALLPAGLPERWSENLKLTVWLGCSTITFVACLLLLAINAPVVVPGCDEVSFVCLGY